MKIRSLMFVVVAAATATGCAAAQPPTPVADGIQTIQRESTADKLLARGKAFASAGDLTRAEQYLVAALDAGADEKRTLPLLMRVCVEAKRYRVALDYAEPRLERDPDDVDLRYLVATLQRAVGNDEAAEETLEQAIAQRPGDADLHFALASVLHDGKRSPKKADDHFREYLRLAPRGRHVAEARGSLLRSVE
jgi:tetratricopeptide (TPR) repeat protein